MAKPFERIFDDFERIVVPGTTHWNHPRFFAYFATSAAPAAVLAEALAATLDVKAMLWRTSPAATELEEVTMRLARPAARACRLRGRASSTTPPRSRASRRWPPRARRWISTFASTAWPAAHLPRLRIYVTEHTHSHVEKAAIALGVGRDNVVRVACDDEFRMRADALERRIEADLARRHAAVGRRRDRRHDVDDVGRSGARDRRRCARARNVWLHVDAAYAGIGRDRSRVSRHCSTGVERADSLVVNPHKWMFVPMDLSVLFLQGRSDVRRAFSLVPEYLTTPEDDVRQLHGLRTAARAPVPRAQALVRAAPLRRRGHPRRSCAATSRSRRSSLRGCDAEPAWEVLAPHPLSVVCFRYRAAGLDEAALDALNERSCTR